MKFLYKNTYFYIINKKTFLSLYTQKVVEQKMEKIKIFFVY